MSTSQAVEIQCESCGMPMSEPELHGTNIDGSGSDEYCCYCFQDGNFTVHMSKESFIDMQVKIAMEKFKMDEPQARAMASAVIPTLKRWHQ